MHLSLLAARISDLPRIIMYLHVRNHVTFMNFVPTKTSGDTKLADFSVFDNCEQIKKDVFTHPIANCMVAIVIGTVHSIRTIILTFYVNENFHLLCKSKITNYALPFACFLTLSHKSSVKTQLRCDQLFNSNSIFVYF